MILFHLSDAGNDDDDSLFTVKRNVQLKFAGDTNEEKESAVGEKDKEEEEGDLPLVQKKIKIKTKASIVKQIRKKNIKVNEKVTFDEDGNVGRFVYSYICKLFIFD